MSSLSPDQVRHIARLARLRLQDDEVQTYAQELTSILSYVEQLTQVDTANVEPTASVTDRQHDLRDDTFGPPNVSAEALLGTSPLPLVDHQIQTPSAHG